MDLDKITDPDKLRAMLRAAIKSLDNIRKNEGSRYCEVEEWEHREDAKRALSELYYIGSQK